MELKLILPTNDEKSRKAHAAAVEAFGGSGVPCALVGMAPQDTPSGEPQAVFMPLSSGTRLAHALILLRVATFLLHEECKDNMAAMLQEATKGMATQ